MKDDRLDAINLLDLREQPLGHRRLRDDESVWIIDDLGVVHDHLPNRDARLGDDRRDPGQDSRLRCVRRDATATPNMSMAEKLVFTVSAAEWKVGESVDPAT